MESGIKGLGSGIEAGAGLGILAPGSLIGLGMILISHAYTLDIAKNSSLGHQKLALPDFWGQGLKFAMRAFRYSLNAITGEKYMASLRPCYE